MLLRTIQLQISPDLFDVHFHDFIYENWKEADVIEHRFRNVRLRFEVYLQIKEKAGAKILIAEIERTKISEQHIEMRAALVNAILPYTYLFIDSFYRFLEDRWKGYGFSYVIPMLNLPGLLQRCGLDYTEANKFSELTNRKFLSSVYIDLDERLRNELFDPQYETAYQAVLEELQKRLPPIDKYPGNTASVINKKSGRPGLNDEENFYRLAMAQEAKEIKHSNPEMGWKEIAIEIGWDRGGTPTSKIRLLEYARNNLQMLLEHDPEGILIKLSAWKEKKKTK